MSFSAFYQQAGSWTLYISLWEVLQLSLKGSIPKPSGGSLNPKRTVLSHMLIDESKFFNIRVTGNVEKPLS
jgi:hypothetical protein